MAQAQPLDVKPGLCKKTIKMESGGRTVRDATIDACMTADDLDLNRSTEKLAASPSCKVMQQDLPPQQVKVVLHCQDISPESTTQVKSREYVVVTATTKPASGGEVSHSSEEWRFVKRDCAKEQSR